MTVNHIQGIPKFGFQTNGYDESIYLIKENDI